MRFYRLLIFVSWLLLSNSISAHEVNSLLLSFSKSDTEWKFEIVIDAGKLAPELLEDDSQYLPRQWLYTLSEDNYQTLRASAEELLYESILLSFAGEPIVYDVYFPDFLEEPPSFPVLFSGGAYLSAEVKGPLEAQQSGGFKIHVTKDDAPDVIIELVGPDANEEDFQYITMEPGGTEVLFIVDSMGVSHLPNRSRGLSAISLILLGYEHVIPSGLDHVLFILLLFLMARQWRPLLAQSLVFTIAHCITLGLAVANIMPLQQGSIFSQLIEPVIALSILYLAIENMVMAQSKVGASTKRLVVIFLFGLIHGLGFAGSLGSALQQGDHWLFPLAMANIGVELAQISVLVLAWITTIWLCQREYYPTIQKVSSCIIALYAAWLLVTRLLSAF